MGTLHPLLAGGEASRYDFARAVFELAGLGQKVVPVCPEKSQVPLSSRAA